MKKKLWCVWCYRTCKMFSVSMKKQPNFSLRDWLLHVDPVKLILNVLMSSSQWEWFLWDAQWWQRGCLLKVRSLILVEGCWYLKNATLVSILLKQCWSVSARCCWLAVFCVWLSPRHVFLSYLPSQAVHEYWSFVFLSAHTGWTARGTWGELSWI